MHYWLREGMVLANGTIWCQAVHSSRVKPFKRELDHDATDIFRKV
jgi:hypothetical protein